MAAFGSALSISKNVNCLVCVFLKKWFSVANFFVNQILNKNFDVAKIPKPVSRQRIFGTLVPFATEKKEAT
jgi:hypothetical protein